jgi:hypothetical protein
MVNCLINKSHLKVTSLKGSALVYLINYPYRNRVYLVELYIPIQSGRKAGGNGSDAVYFWFIPGVGHAAV